MVSAVRATPYSSPVPSTPTPGRQTAFMHADRYERGTPGPADPQYYQPAPRRRENTFCNRVLDVLLCPPRCAQSWFTVLLCAPCLMSSACCMND